MVKMFIIIIITGNYTLNLLKKTSIGKYILYLIIFFNIWGIYLSTYLLHFCYEWIWGYSKRKCYISISVITFPIFYTYISKAWKRRENKILMNSFDIYVQYVWYLWSMMRFDVTLNIKLKIPIILSCFIQFWAKKTHFAILIQTRLLHIIELLSIKNLINHSSRDMCNTLQSWRLKNIYVLLLLIVK